MTKILFLVSSRYILSAAHCLHPKNEARAIESEVYVVVGLFNTQKVDDTEQVIDAEKFIIHPDWNPIGGNFDADISLILMKDLIKYTNYVRPVCLPTKSEADQVIFGKKGAVAGWGKSIFKHFEFN